MSEDKSAAPAGHPQRAGGPEGTHDQRDGESPLLRVVRGTPDETELAALTVALAGVAAANSAPEADSRPRPLSVWADPSRRLRGHAGTHPHQPGRGAWWASSLPR